MTQRNQTLLRLVGVVVVFASGYWVYASAWRDGSDADPQAQFGQAEMLGVLYPTDNASPQRDQVLIEHLTGSADIDDDLANGAFCIAYVDWVWDILLSPAIVISTDPGMLRAAELYAEAVAAGDDDRAALIARAEQTFWARDADVDRLGQWAGDLAPESLRMIAMAYVEDRKQPPSAEATNRFVVFVSQRTTREQQIVYLDAWRVSPGALERPAGERHPTDVLVGGEDDTRTFNPADCDELANRWGRYDPELAELPSIEDRWQRKLDDSV